jgi:hypothetical protein
LIEKDTCPASLRTRRQSSKRPDSARTPRTVSGASLTNAFIISLYSSPLSWCLSVTMRIGSRITPLSPRDGFRAGSLQGLLPGAPTDPGVRVKDAPGSSRCGIAVPLTIRSFCGDTLVRHGGLGVVPTPRPQRGTPFAPRGPEGRSPASTLLWGAATPCRPSRRASFPSLGDTVIRPLFVPTSSGQSCGSTWSW